MWSKALSFCCGKHNDFLVGRILLPFLFEISMIKSNLLLNLMVASLLPFSWVKLFPIAHGFKLFFFWIHFVSEIRRV